MKAELLISLVLGANAAIDFIALLNTEKHYNAIIQCDRQPNENYISNNKFVYGDVIGHIFTVMQFILLVALIGLLLGEQRLYAMLSFGLTFLFLFAIYLKRKDVFLINNKVLRIYIYLDKLIWIALSIKLIINLNRV